MQTNSNISYTGLVEKYVGTAYDKMAELHSRLEELLLISKSIADGSFDEVAGIADEIQGLIDKIDEFNATYYGALDAAPVADPAGNPITEGDLYFDTYKSLLMVFVGEFWIPLGAVENTVERWVVSGAHVDNPRGEPLIELKKPYLPGTNNLTIHRHRRDIPTGLTVGELLLSKSVDSEIGDYTEIDEYTIRLTNETLLGDELIFSVGTEAATVTHVGAVGRYWQKMPTDNEQVVKLPEGKTYIPGSNNLTVHAKRKDAFQTMELQIHDEYDIEGNLVRQHDYSEDSPTQILFHKPLEQFTEIQFTVGHIVASKDAHFEVIMANGQPNVDAHAEGKFWFKTDTGRLYILYFDSVTNNKKQWVAVSNEDHIIPADGYDPPAPPMAPSVHSTVFQTKRPDPANFVEGTLWFNSQSGNLHINYFDDDSHQWVKVST